MAFIDVDKVYDLKDVLHVGRNSEVHRAVRRADGLEVVLKLIRSESLMGRNRAVLLCQREFDILQRLDTVDGVVRALDFSAYKDGGVLILQDTGGTSLARAFNAVANQASFIDIAQQLSDTIGRVHLQRVIHKDLKPHNILLHVQSMRVFLMDFGLSTFLIYDEEKLKAESEQKGGQANGTLAYMAPEQSGRVMTSVDYRADFYSLGVTFYHLLAGHLPFEGKSGSDLIDCHLTMKPTPLIDLPKTRIPVCQALSDIVDKLLQKDPNMRYQSARGLSADLRICSERLEELVKAATEDFIADSPASPTDDDEREAKAEHIDVHTAGPSTFVAKHAPQSVRSCVSLPRQFSVEPLARHDSPCFLPSRTRSLYGRARERIQLDTMLRRVAGDTARRDVNFTTMSPTQVSTVVQGSSRSTMPYLCLIEGAAGIGKSALVNATLAQQENLCVCHCKFEQLRLAQPYAGLIPAVQQLVQGVLSLGDRELAEARKNVTEKLGAMANQLIPLFPDLRHLVHERVLETPESSEPFVVIDAPSRERVHLAFGKLLDALAHRRFPIVFVLDDCHWIDQSSIELLQFLTLDADLSSVAFILSYRPFTQTDKHANLDVTEATNVSRIRTLYETVHNDRRVTHNALLITLGPLPRDAFVDIIQECSPLASIALAYQLASVVHERTAGNPYFALRYLHHLNQQDPPMLFWSEAKGMWNVRFDAVFADKHRSDNVLAMLEASLEQLPHGTRLLLRRAAYIGVTFRLDQLCTIVAEGAIDSHTDFGSDDDDDEHDDEPLRRTSDAIGSLTKGMRAARPRKTAATARRNSMESGATPMDLLEIALDAALVLPAGEGAFSFAHERIQQACIALPGPEPPEVVHLHTARLLYDEWLLRGGAVVIDNEMPSDTASLDEVAAMAAASERARRASMPASVLLAEHNKQQLDRRAAPVSMQLIASRARRASIAAPNATTRLHQQMLGARRELLSGLYAITSHFEAAVSQIKVREEKDEVARLFYVVGMGALQSSAFEVALRYLSLAARLAGQTSTRPPASQANNNDVPWWTLWLALARCRAALASDELQETLDALAKNARDPVEYSDYCQMRAGQLEQLGRLPDATQLLCDMLKRLDFPDSLCTMPTPEQWASEQDKARKRILKVTPSSRKAIMALALLPECTDEMELVRQRALLSIMPPAYGACMPLNCAVGAELIARVIEHGMSAYGCSAFGWCASILAKFGQLKRAYAFADLCEMASSKYPASAERGSSLTLCYGLVQWRKRNHAEFAQQCERMTRVNLDVGNMVYAGYSTLHMTWSRFLAAKSLSHFVSGMKPWLTFTASADNQFVSAYINTVVQAAKTLLRRTNDPYTLDAPDGSFTEAGIYEQFGAVNGIICLMHIYKALVYFVNEQYDMAWTNLDVADARKDGLNDLCCEPDRVFLRGMTAARVLHHRRSSTRANTDNVPPGTPARPPTPSTCGLLPDISDAQLAERLQDAIDLSCVAGETKLVGDPLDPESADDAVTVWHLRRLLLVAEQRSLVSTSHSTEDVMRTFSSLIDRASAAALQYLTALAIESFGMHCERRGMVFLAGSMYRASSRHYAEWGAAHKLYSMRARHVAMNQLAHGSTVPTSPKIGARDTFGSASTGSSVESQNSGKDHRYEMGRAVMSSPHLFDSSSSLDSRGYVDVKDSLVQFESHSQSGFDYVDMRATMRAILAVSCETQPDMILERLLAALCEVSSARRVVMVLRRASRPKVVGVADPNGVQLFNNPVTLESYDGTPAQAEAEWASGAEDMHAGLRFAPHRIVRYVMRTQDRVSIDDAAAAVGHPLLKDAYVHVRRPRAMLAIPVTHQRRVLGVCYLENELTPSVFTDHRTDIIAVLLAQFAISVQNAFLLEESRRYHEASARFVPQPTLAMLGVRSVADVKLGASSTAKCSIVYIDIRNFTRVSDYLGPSTTFGLLNSLLAKIGPLVRRQGGFIDNVLGDAVLAIFPQSAPSAVSTAIAIVETIRAFNLRHVRSGVRGASSHRVPRNFGMYDGDDNVLFRDCSRSAETSAADSTSDDSDDDGNDDHSSDFEDDDDDERVFASGSQRDQAAAKRRARREQHRRVRQAERERAVSPSDRAGTAQSRDSETFKSPMRHRTPQQQQQQQQQQRNHDRARRSSVPANSISQQNHAGTRKRDSADIGYNAINPRHRTSISSSGRSRHGSLPLSDMSGSVHYGAAADEAESLRELLNFAQHDNDARSAYSFAAGDAMSEDGRRRVSLSNSSVRGGARASGDYTNTLRQQSDARSLVGGGGGDDTNDFHVEAALVNAHAVGAVANASGVPIESVTLRAPLNVGIGVHTGDVVIGVVGESEHMTVAVVSDTVSLAARLESLCKACHANILVSAESLVEPELVAHRYIGKIQIEGRREVLLVYEVFDSDNHIRLSTSTQLHHAMLLYQQAKMEDALALFTEILYPEKFRAQQEGVPFVDNDDDAEHIDGVVQLYCEACRLYIRSDVRRIRSDWHGILSVTKGGRVFVDQSMLTEQQALEMTGADLLTWQWNPFSCSAEELSAHLISMFKHFDLLETFDIEEGTLRTFLLTVQLAYQPNPYHNFTHAFDVTHAMFCLIDLFGVGAVLRPIDKLTLLLACICHDVAHPGVNNAFLVATESPLAMLYNDISVLENHHCATAFKIMAQSESNVLKSLKPQDRQHVRKSIIKAILATDMAQHQTLTSAVDTHLRTRAAELTTAGKPVNIEHLFDIEAAVQRELLFVALIKFCDISNVFKDTTLADLWMHRITSEYFQQGDQMRPRGLPVPEMMDRSSTRPRQEITRGFIVHVAAPFFDTCIAPLLSNEHADFLRSRVTANRNALRSAAQPPGTSQTLPVPPRRGSFVVNRDDDAPLSNFDAPSSSEGHSSRRASAVDVLQQVWADTRRGSFAPSDPALSSAPTVGARSDESDR